jgi:hypothetical protein
MLIPHRNLLEDDLRVAAPLERFPNLPIFKRQQPRRIPLT